MRPARGNPVRVRGAWPLLLAGGCTVADPDPEWIARQQAATVEVAGFVLPSVLEAGFDAPGPSRELERGDEVVFGLRLDEAGDARDWFVHVVVVDPAIEAFERRERTTNAIARLEASVYAADGALLGKEQLSVSVGDLTNGLARACRGESEPAPRASGVVGPTLGSIPESVRAVLALQNLLQVVRKSDVLFDVLYQVLDKPSLWSIVVHLGVRVSIASHFDAARPAPPFSLREPAPAAPAPATAKRDQPAWEVPMELKLNGAPALRSVLTVVDPDSPLGLAAGVVALRAFRPSDPKVTFTMQLLAARRGRPE